MYSTRLLPFCLLVLKAGILFSIQVSGQAFAELSTNGLPALQQAKSVWANFDTTTTKLELLLTGKDNSGKAFAQVYQLADSATRKFNPIGAGLIALSNGSVAVHDYNHDHLIDILLTGTDDDGKPVTKLFANKSKNTFEEVTISLPGLRNGEAKWIDLDNDGWKDIVLNGINESDQQVTYIYQNAPDGFVWKQHNLPGFSDGVLLDIHLDNDSRPDVFISGLNSSGNAFSGLFKNLGNFQFEPLPQPLEALYDGNAAIGDFNGDGKTDLLVSGLNTSKIPVTLLYIRDNENFTAADLPLPGVHQSTVYLAELTSDGLTDLLISGTDANGHPLAKLLRNGGDGKLYDTPAALKNLADGHVSLVDFTSDGNLEILQTGMDAGNPQVRYLFNLATRKNLGPTAPTNPQVTKVDNGTVFSWSAAIDDISPAPGLSYEVYVWHESSYTFYKTLETSGTEKRRNLVAHGSQGQLTSYTIFDLPEGNYQWGIQAIDNAFETRGKKGICHGGKIIVRSDGIITEPDTEPEPTVRKDIFVPNLFTPNRDGHNDAFKIYGSGFASLHLKIYDRSGALIFETSDVNTATGSGWDGTRNGSPLPNGTYFWALNGSYTDGSQVQFNNKRTGAIHLLR